MKGGVCCGWQNRIENMAWLSCEKSYGQGLKNFE